MSDPLKETPFCELDRDSRPNFGDERRLRARIEQLEASRERLKSAIEFAHSEGFQWPSDPMQEFSADQQTVAGSEK